MRLTIFPSDKGDCLLLTGADGRHVLIDGGMRHSYQRHVAPQLGALQAAGESLDVVYVSHIDEDHIAGVLQLADDLLAWKIFDHVTANGDPDYPPPEVPRPPAVGEVWHNGFHEQLGKNAGQVEDMLLQMSTVLSGHPNAEVRLIAAEQRNLATSERQAALLQRRLGGAQLGIPLNQPSGGRLMMVRDDNQPVQVGGMSFHILAPFAKDLKALKKRWNAWLKSAKGKKQLAEIRRNTKEKEDLLRSSEVHRFVTLLEAEATALGNREDVSTPNLASLMLLAEELGRTALLTGDGFGDDALEGLRHAGRINGAAGSGLHVDICKIPHHGATANMTDEFATTITADHYVFCGNGEHENPEIEVVERVIDSRIGPPASRSRNAETGQPFKLWFSCSSRFDGLRIPNVRHMQAVEELVEARVLQSAGKLSFQFLVDQPLIVEV